AARAGELAERADRLARFLDLLAGESGGGPAGVPMQELRGVLDWPVAGEVEHGFGFRLDPRYRTRIPHNGLTIGARHGEPVRAVYPGEVLFAAPFEGYGPTAVVLHPGRVFTLYAGLDELAVERGQRVLLGEALGTAGGSLYFEVRVDNRPEDPRGWLR
ncbi:MAG TPA: peptidoglycan DD-metalloendopeptidase family protein, partial [Thermoanaerobaculia bacterium]|nr:peptidoglycan DD-metalloendopeptidase family protein [Thermoanaerobaculia bacterium]